MIGVIQSSVAANIQPVHREARPVLSVMYNDRMSTEEGKKILSYISRRRMFIPDRATKRAEDLLYFPPVSTNDIALGSRVK